VERFTSFDGTEIAYQRWGGDDPGVPIVLHHGFVVDADLNWNGTGVVAALEPTGRRVFAPDARGHGRSGKPHDPASYGEAKMAEDLAGLFDVIGADEIDLVGYSMGAVVSLIAASQDTRIRRLAVGGVGAAVVELGGVDTRSLPNDALEQALRTDDPSTIEHPGASGMRQFADTIGADRLALAAQAASVHREPIPLDHITAPTLLVVGDADELAVRPEVLAAAIPDCTVELIEGDHMAAVANPRFAQAVIAFLT
jgi:pimeloyl-ACP methyl ester carboxylesterase